MQINSNLLKKLVSTYGPSSREEYIAEVIKEEIEDYVDEIRIDALGNLITRKKGPGKKVMIAAHMDQIGFMVIDIDDNGFIRFTNVGGISPSISLGQRVIFENNTTGIISAEPVDDLSKLKLSDMYIDIGAFNKEEAELKVEIGDIAIYKGGFEENENVIFSSYLDDRVGCYIAIETLKSITNNENDLYFVFTTQEEVGLRGAKTSAYSIDPDIAIALDVTMSGDTPKATRLALGLDKGAAIKVKDGSLITNPKLKNNLISLAKENNIKYQMEILEGAGTDSGAIHLTKTGVPSGVISLPIRYVHSPVEMASKSDIVACVDLLKVFLNQKL